MALVIKDKMDITDLLYKGKLVGAEIQLEDDNFYLVEDAYVDWATFEINVKVKGITEALSFNLREKHIIRIDETKYDNSKLKRKRRGRKKRKRRKR